MQVTERSDLLDASVCREIANQVNEFDGYVLIWVGIPCAGGTSWSFVNMKHPTAALKVKHHVKVFHRLWDAFLKFMTLIKKRTFIAMEWPRNCRYWKAKKVAKFFDAKRLITYNFHGCMVGIKNKDNDVPIKKPWTIATDMQTLGNELSRYQCDNSHDHVQGRGQDLKPTERYTFVMTDLIHSVFRLAAFQVRTSVPAIRFAMTEGSQRGTSATDGRHLGELYPRWGETHCLPARPGLGRVSQRTSCLMLGCCL